jgi:hypothetical protein
MAEDGLSRVTNKTELYSFLSKAVTDDLPPTRYLTSPVAKGITVYEPCSDARIQRGDDFTFGLAFVGFNSFSGQTQLCPCDRRLNLASFTQLAVFRPKVDEISLPPSTPPPDSTS